MVWAVMAVSVLCVYMCVCGGGAGSEGGRQT